MGSRRYDDFRSIVAANYKAHGRHDLPWRQTASNGLFDPYHILVSEIMLQQTQVTRVIPKYLEFLQTFPHIQVLASAPLSKVLAVWSGLGYNRRAKFLWQAADIIEKDGFFPQTLAGLHKLPGVGPNTAGAVMVYAYNLPAPFIETNIRTVFLHHFFGGQREIRDASILDLVAKTMERSQPRAWFWSLMDYGSHLKSTVGNPNAASRSYAKQSVYAGSNRQIRGRVIHELLNNNRTINELQDLINDSRVHSVLGALVKEHMVVERHGVYSVSP